MELGNQVKVGLAVPPFLVALFLGVWGIVQGIFLVLSVFERHPTTSLVLVAALAILLAIPFLPLLLGLGLVTGALISAPSFISGLAGFAVALVATWGIGNFLLLWIRSWPLNWENQDGGIVSFWRHQVFFEGYLLAYLSPAVLACLAAYRVYLLIAR